MLLVFSLQNVCLLLYYTGSFNGIAGTVFSAFMNSIPDEAVEVSALVPVRYSACVWCTYIRGPLATHRLLTLGMLTFMGYQLRTWRLRRLGLINERVTVLTGICDKRNILFINDRYHMHRKICNETYPVQVLLSAFCFTHLLKSLVS